MDEIKIQKRSAKYKVYTVSIDADLVDKYRKVCKRERYVQSAMIAGMMKTAINKSKKNEK